MSEPCRFRRGEGYGACDDVQGLGKATPQQDSAQDKMSILAKFGPAVESCSKNHSILKSQTLRLFILRIIIKINIFHSIAFARRAMYNYTDGF